ncbi:glycosyltransferase family 2 protein [Candidatus Kaiserbacteria bacterium]|nr:glycosyltransferase family 2 protein [Candidatus Kaiserbacteria bacterium]
MDTGHSTRVSVIIPTFNRSHYLRQAIISVLTQTYPDFEILVVDDGSTDDTATVVTEFDDPRIIYLYQENAGRSAARNRGLGTARGEFIGFLDDDDLYLPDKLAQQVAFLDQNQDVGLVTGGYQLIAADGSLREIHEAWKMQSKLTLPDCLYSCPLLTCTILLRRRWLTLLDHWFDPTMERAEDTDFWIRLLVAGCRMAWIPHIVSGYRLHNENSQQDRERYYFSYLTLLDKLYMQTNLPVPALEEQAMIYAHYHVLGACHAYARGETKTGQERLVQAATVAPDAMQGTPPLIVSSIAGFVQSNQVADSTSLIENMFTNLPPQLRQLQAFRRYALSAAHMQRVFTAPAAYERPAFKDWLLGVYQYPRWLWNRGVWSILIRRILLASIATRASR